MNKIFEKVPKTKDELMIAICYRLFGMEEIRELFLHLGLKDIILCLQAYGFNPSVTGEITSDWEDLFKRAIIYKEIKDELADNPEQLKEIEVHAMSFIASNKKYAEARKARILQAYQEVLETEFFSRDLTIIVSKIDSTTNTRLRQLIPDLPDDPTLILEHLAQESVNFLTLSNFIMTCGKTSSRKFKPNEERSKNKKQTLNTDMEVEDEQPTEVGTIEQSSYKSNDNTKTSSNVESPGMNMITSTANKVDLEQNRIGKNSMMDETNQQSSSLNSNSLTGHGVSQMLSSSTINNLNLNTIGHTLQVLVDSLPERQQHMAKSVLYIRINDNNEQVISINLDNCHCLSYLQFKQETLQTGTVINAAFRVKFKEEHIAAKMAEEQEWLHHNAESEHMLVQNIINYIKNNKCKILRKKKLLNTAIDPCFSDITEVKSVLITGIPITVTEQGELMAFTLDVISSAGLTIAHEDTYTLNEMNPCIPLPSPTSMSNGLPVYDTQMLSLQIAHSFITTTTYVSITTKHQYTVALNVKGKTVKSFITVALNLLPIAWTREALLSSHSLVAIRGTSSDESTIIGSHLDKAIKESFSEDDVTTILVPVHTRYSIINQHLQTTRVTDTVSYFIVLVPGTLSMEEIDNMLAALGLGKTNANNSISVQYRSLEIRRSIAEFESHGMPAEVIRAQDCWQILGLGEITARQVYDVIPPPTQASIAYVKIRPRTSDTQKQKELGTHEVFIIWKPTMEATQITKLNIMWFKQFKRGDGGRLDATHYRFGQVTRHKQGSRNNSYNSFSLSSDLLEKKISWNSEDLHVPIKTVHALASSSTVNNGDDFIPQNRSKKRSSKS